MEEPLPEVLQTDTGLKHLQASRHEGVTSNNACDSAIFPPQSDEWVA